MAPSGRFRAPVHADFLDLGARYTGDIRLNEIAARHKIYLPSNATGETALSMIGEALGADRAMRELERVGFKGISSGTADAPEYLPFGAYQGNGNNLWLPFDMIEPESRSLNGIGVTAGATAAGLGLSALSGEDAEASPLSSLRGEGDLEPFDPYALDDEQLSMLESMERPEDRPSWNERAADMVRGTGSVLPFPFNLGAAANADFVEDPVDAGAEFMIGSTARLNADTIRRGAPLLSVEPGYYAFAGNEMPEAEPDYRQPFFEDEDNLYQQRIMADGERGYDDQLLDLAFSPLELAGLDLGLAGKGARGLGRVGDALGGEIAAVRRGFSRGGPDLFADDFPDAPAGRSFGLSDAFAGPEPVGLDPHFPLPEVYPGGRLLPETDPVYPPDSGAWRPSTRELYMGRVGEDQAAMREAVGQSFRDAVTGPEPVGLDPHFALPEAYSGGGDIPWGAIGDDLYPPNMRGIPDSVERATRESGEAAREMFVDWVDRRLPPSTLDLTAANAARVDVLTRARNVLDEMRAGWGRLPPAGRESGQRAILREDMGELEGLLEMDAPSETIEAVLARIHGRRDRYAPWFREGATGAARDQSEVGSSLTVANRPTQPVVPPEFGPHNQMKRDIRRGSIQTGVLGAGALTALSALTLEDMRRRRLAEEADARIPLNFVDMPPPPEEEPPAPQEVTLGEELPGNFGALPVRPEFDPPAYPSYRNTFPGGALVAPDPEIFSDLEIDPNNPDQLAALQREFNRHAESLGMDPLDIDGIIGTLSEDFGRLIAGRYNRDVDVSEDPTEAFRLSLGMYDGDATIEDIQRLLALGAETHDRDNPLSWFGSDTGIDGVYGRRTREALANYLGLAIDDPILDDVATDPDLRNEIYYGRMTGNRMWQVQRGVR